MAVTVCWLGVVNVRRSNWAVGLLLLWIGCGLPVEAVCEAGGLSSPKYLVDSWQTEDGLPHNAVTAILQSRGGYLWVGTSNGLARFDGIRFTTYKALENPELRSNRILSLFEDAADNIWIGTADAGVIRFNQGRFAARKSRQALSSEEVLCLRADDQGFLWVGTGSGLNRWEQSQSRFRAFFALDGLPDDRIESMALDVGGSLIVGTRKGLARASGIGFTALIGADGEPHGRIDALLKTRAGDLWVGGQFGLWRRRGNAAIWESSERSTSAILERADGEVVYGTATGSVRGLPAGEGPGNGLELARFDVAIKALCEDREGSIWVGTAGQGLRRLKPVQLRLVTLPEPSFAQDEIVSLAQVSSGEVWLASGSGRLRKWTSDSLAPLAHQDYPASAQARVLASDDQSGLWIGTQGDGLFRWRTGRLEHWNQQDGLSDSDIRALHVGRDGGVWVGTANGGLNYLRDGQIRRFATPWGFDGTWAAVLEEDGEGRLWIGTNGDGLFCLERGVFTAYSTHQGLPNGQVHALAATGPDELWVGTAAGLVRVHDSQLRTYTVRDGLPEDDICQIQDGTRGNLWLGCGGGVFRVRKSQLRELDQGITHFLDPVPYGKPDGLPPLECLPGTVLESGRRCAGTLWFATSKGLISVVPRELVFNALPPPVVLEQLLVENNPVALERAVRIPPGREAIQVNFTALSLVAPEKVRFQCQLLGFDRDWVQVGASRSMRYTKVPPGRYELRVIARNNDGVWNQSGAGFVMLVQAFWWQTVWFRVAAAALTAGSLAALVRLRRLRRRELDRLRIRLAGDLHDEVGSSLWSIALLSQMLQKHGQMGPDERREISEIHRIATQTSNAVRDIVWLINPAYDTMQDLVLRMQDFAAMILKGTEHHIASEGIDLAQRLPLEFRQNMFLMFKEAITNVAKHAAASKVEVLLEKEAQLLRLSVRDNGVGFDRQIPAKGNGLCNLRTRAEKLRGNLVVTTAPGQGTTLRFELPSP